MRKRVGPKGSATSQVAQHVQETITLAVSLSHTLALLDYREAIGKLYRMLDLQHRRLRVEAAAALARLGEQAGVKALTEMAAEPLVRLRAHAYAAELGVLDEIPLEFRSPQALAESELVIRLAEPDLFGIAPAAWELVDHRATRLARVRRAADLLPVSVHLSLLGRLTYTNLAVVGPFAHALMPDLTVFPLDDVYAVYAGWHVEHDELQRSRTRFVEPGSRPQEVERLVGGAGRSRATRRSNRCSGGSFSAHGCSSRTATRQARTRDRRGSPWAATTGFHRAIRSARSSADLAYCLFVGRQLLRRFNPDFGGRRSPSTRATTRMHDPLAVEPQNAYDKPLIGPRLLDRGNRHV